jgi:hypothetical protein
MAFVEIVAFVSKAARAIQPLDVSGVLSASIARQRRTRINHS